MSSLNMKFDFEPYDTYACPDPSGAREYLFAINPTSTNPSIILIAIARTSRTSEA